MIANDDLLARHVYAPRMVRGADEVIWQEAFEFETAQGMKESVVWRVKMPSDDEVHAIGCAHQRSKQQQGKNIEYRGFMSAAAREVRETTTSGHRIDVVYAPEEGEWHAHIQIDLAAGFAKLSKHDKADVRALMAKAFKGITHEHQCGSD